MGNHDYYFGALLILFPAIILPFILYIKQHHFNIFEGRLTKVFITIFLIFNFIYCLNVVKLKTLAKEGNFVIVGNHEFVSLRGRFKRMKPHLLELGIKEDDKIISLPDYSFNASLYLLDRRGWTNFLNYSKTEEIEEIIEKGAKYLMISNPSVYENDFIKPFLNNKIGSFEGIDIFKLEKTNNSIN